MRKKEEIRFLKRSLTLNESNAITASYEEKGYFKVSLLPTKEVDQRTGLKRRYLLIGKRSIDIEENDMIEGKGGLYRVLRVSDFQKYREALLEKES